MRHVIVSILLAAVFGLSSVPTTQAELITIEITAIVDYVKDEGDEHGYPDGYLEGNIDIGDIITGYYTYESTTSDSNPSSYVGDYWHYTSPCGIFLSVGGFDFQTDAVTVDFIVRVVNDYTSGGLHDGYGLISYTNLPLSSGANVDIIRWRLEDTSTTALTDDALPVTPPILGQWQENCLRLHGERGGYIVDAHVTSAIPEPATILLFAFSGLLLRKRR